MGRIRTYLGVLILTLPTGAFAIETRALRDIFAQCAGRYSAEMEHAWLIDTDRADDHRARRLDFLSLLDATTPADQARSILHARIEAKAAHAALLTIATFVADTARSDAAQATAHAHLSICRKLLLKG